MTEVILTATNPSDSSVVPVACNEKGELKLEEPIKFDGNLDNDLNVTGNGSFTGRVLSEDYLTSDGNAYITGNYESEGSIGGLFRATAESITAMGECLRFNRVGGGRTEVVINMHYDGSAVFAHGKAGLTAEGHLWVTTVAGETVMLNNLVNGLGEWVVYTPAEIRSSPAPGP